MPRLCYFCEILWDTHSAWLVQLAGSVYRVHWFGPILTSWIHPVKTLLCQCSVLLLSVFHCPVLHTWWVPKSLKWTQITVYLPLPYLRLFQSKLASQRTSQPLLPRHCLLACLMMWTSPRRCRHHPLASPLMWIRHHPLAYPLMWIRHHPLAYPLMWIRHHLLACPLMWIRHHLLACPLMWIRRRLLACPLMWIRRRLLACTLMWIRRRLLACPLMWIRRRLLACPLMWIRRRLLACPLMWISPLPPRHHLLACPLMWISPLPPRHHLLACRLMSISPHRSRHRPVIPLPATPACRSSKMAWTPPPQLMRVPVQSPFHPVLPQVLPSPLLWTVVFCLRPAKMTSASTLKRSASDSFLDKVALVQFTLQLTEARQWRSRDFLNTEKRRWLQTPTRENWMPWSASCNTAMLCQCLGRHVLKDGRKMPASWCSTLGVRISRPTCWTLTTPCL